MADKLLPISLHLYFRRIEGVNSNDGHPRFRCPERAKQISPGQRPGETAGEEVITLKG